MSKTALDDAHASMEAHPQNTALRLQFYQRIMVTELHLFLEAEPVGDAFTPRIFNTTDGRFVLTFDSADRLAEFTTVPTPTLLIPGRTLIVTLQGQNIGLGLNLDTAPSATLLSAETIGWMAGIATAPEAVSSGKPAAYVPPRGLTTDLRDALEARLAIFPGTCTEAIAATALHPRGQENLVLALIDTPASIQSNLAAALAEAAGFSGEQNSMLDLMFLNNEGAGEIRKAGTQLALPEVEPVEKPRPTGPGSSPDRPPILR